MFASKCSEVVLTITEPRFCILSGQDVFPPEIGHPQDQYGKWQESRNHDFRTEPLVGSTVQPRSIFPDEVQVFYELGIKSPKDCNMLAMELQKLMLRYRRYQSSVHSLDKTQCALSHLETMLF
jgi:hypothetical protein